MLRSRAIAMLAALLAVIGVVSAPARSAAMQDSTTRIALERGFGPRSSSAPKPPLAEVPSFAELASGSPLFLQRDPNGFEDSVNLYAFARHDPINNRDPTGRWSESEMKGCMAAGNSRSACEKQLTPTIGRRPQACGGFDGKCVDVLTEQERNADLGAAVESAAGDLGCGLNPAGCAASKAALAGADALGIENPAARGIIATTAGVLGGLAAVKVMTAATAATGGESGALSLVDDASGGLSTPGGGAGGSAAGAAGELPAFTATTQARVLASSQAAKGKTTVGASLLSKRVASGELSGVAATQQNAETIIRDVLANPLRSRATGRFGQLDVVGYSFDREVSMRVNIHTGMLIGFRRVDF